MPVAKVPLPHPLSQIFHRPFLGHQKAIVNVIHHPDKQVVLSASQDATVRVWNYENEEKVSQNRFKLHSDAITDLSLHPTNDFCLTTSKDKSWIFSDLNTGMIHTV